MRAFRSDRLSRNHRKKRKKKKRPGILKRLRKWIFIVVLAMITLSVLIVLPFRWIDPPTSAFMLQDQSGRVPIQYEWLDWNDIGDAAAIAVVAAEDQKFAIHFGFDVKSIQESVESYNKGESLRGASTITQQVAKNLYLWPQRSFFRKGMEAWLTLLIETIWPKKRILEVYLNVAEFGPGIYGVNAASEAFFGTAPNNLNDYEAALLAAVLPNPKQLRVSAPSNYVRERQQWIISQMKRLRRESWLMLLD